MATSSGSTSADYFDVLIVGKTGMGKSTTSNNLLYDAPGGSDYLTAWKFAGKPEGQERQLQQRTSERFADVPSPHFQSSDPGSPESTTKECELISNDAAKLRILDTPGFQASNFRDHGYTTAYQSNLGIMRQIVRIQANFNLVFKRVLYFLPRGSLEKADAVIQEEIMVMRHFFGDAIFEIMTIVTTLNPHQSRRGYVFTEEEIDETKEALKLTFKLAFDGKEVPNVPPLIYISINDSGQQIMDKIESIQVANPKGIKLVFQKGICANCAMRVSSIEGRRVCFMDDNSPPVAYEETKCHPLIIPKYTKLTKFMGGIAHVVTLGIPYLAGKRWPGFTNSDEKCEACEMPPGAAACYPVGTQWNPTSKKKSNPITVHHTNHIVEVHQDSEQNN